VRGGLAVLQAEERASEAAKSADEVRDFRFYLDWIEREFPGDVVHVEREVSAQFEVTALLMKLHRFKLKNLPVFVFDRVRTVQGEISPFPLVVNFQASARHWARFLGCEQEEVVTVTRYRSQERIAPVTISREQAPCKQVVKRGEQANLWEFPALQAWRLDPGPYVNAGGLLCYDPDTGIDNSTILRGWLKDPRTIPFYAQKHNHTAHIYRLHESRGRDMRAVFWVGHHPAAMKGSSIRIPYGDSHIEAMGGLLGQPIRLVGSETWGDEFLVPADAEVVIEGIIPAHKRSPEGPYGEDWGHTGAQRLEPFMEVTAITHRRDAYWLNYITGQAPYLKDRRENGYLGDYRAITALRVAQSVSPAVISVRPAMMKGAYFIKIRKSREGEAMDIAMAVLSSMEGVKYAFVVDEDVDIDDPEEALWALGARTQWDDDLTVIHRGRAPGTDPSNEEEGVGAKVLIDATMPYPFEPRNAVPQEVLDSVRLADFVPKAFLDSIPRRLFNELPSSILREVQ
jgi:UbiD family decarboxylase